MLPQRLLKYTHNVKLQGSYFDNNNARQKGYEFISVQVIKLTFFINFTIPPERDIPQGIVMYKNGNRVTLVMD